VVTAESAAEPTGEVRCEAPLPLDTWAALLNEWFDNRRETIEIGAAMLRDLTRDLNRAQMTLDGLTGLERARAEQAIANQRAAAVTR